MKENYQISFSGGRTSAYMTWHLLQKYKDKYNFIVTFANTGFEDNRTLEFIRNCDEYFNFNTVWLEADVQHLERKGTGFKIVDYGSASRNGEPFEEVIKKYGIPNASYLHCTRELKLQPMRKYLESLGINHKKIKTAIGIRKDEIRRVSKTSEVENIVYPLIEEFPVDKQDVLDWWEDQAFDLDIEEWDGNCKGCHKKSFKKLFLQFDRDASILEQYIRWEDLYGSVKAPEQNRVFFRGQTSAKNLKILWEEDRKSGASLLNLDMYADGGCSESCEVYETK